MGLIYCYLPATWWLSGKEFASVKEMQETPAQSLGQEDPLEEGMATHSSILAWKTPWTEAPGGLQSMGLLRARHDLETKKQQPHHHLGQYLTWESVINSCWIRVLSSFKRDDLCMCGFCVLAVTHSMWDLSSPTRDRTHDPCYGSMES